MREGRARYVLVAVVVVGLVLGCVRRRHTGAPPSPPDSGLSFRFEAPLGYYQFAQSPRVPPPRGYRWYSTPSRAGGDLVNHILVSDVPSPLVGYIKHLCIDGSRVGGYRVWVCFGQDGRPVLESEIAGNITRRLVIIKDGKIVMAPIVRRQISGCDAVIGFDLSAHEATWLANALHSAAQVQCPSCPVKCHGTGHTTCHMPCGHCAHTCDCPHRYCCVCAVRPSVCDPPCTHRERPSKTCSHVLPPCCPVCAKFTSQCTGHFARSHTCGVCCFRVHSCALCAIAPPLGKELKTVTPADK